MEKEMNEHEKMHKVEVDSRDEVNQLEEFDISVEPFVEETLDFTDSCFWDMIPGQGKVRKKIYVAECDGKNIPTVPPGYLCVLLNYKTRKTAGKKDPLAGSHVLIVPTPKEPRLIPLHQVKKYALNLLRATDAIEDELVRLDVPFIPEAEA